MTTALNTTNGFGLTHPSATVASVIELSAYLSAPPERIWAALRNFDSKSTAGLLKVMHQETNRRLIYTVFGLPGIVKQMIGHVHLQPEGAGTWLHWSLRFNTKPTLLARLFRPLMRASIARTLRDAVRRFKTALEQ
jgi:carbon monoxide dehydrogenase subunit G